MKGPEKQIKGQKLYNVELEVDGKFIKTIAMAFTSEEDAKELADKKNSWYEKEFGKYNNVKFRVVEVRR